jgi:hypothetical protein
MALSLTIAVGSFLDFRTAALDLPEAPHELKIEFEDGDHVFTSPDFELGVIKTDNTIPLVGRFTFGYSYNADKRIITVNGSDY